VLCLLLSLGPATFAAAALAFAAYHCRPSRPTRRPTRRRRRGSG